MKNLKMSMKLLVGFGVVAAVILTISLVSVFNLLGVDGKYSDTIEKQAKPLNPAINAYGAIHAMRAEARFFIAFTGNKEKVRATRILLDKWAKEFEDSASNFAKHVYRPDVKELMENAMKKYYEEFKPGVYKIADEAEKGVPMEELLKYVENVTAPSGAAVASAFLLATDKKMEQLLEASDDCTDKSKSAVTIMIVLLFAGTAVAVFFGIYITALISKPLNDTVRMIAEMEQGHLDARLKLDRKDEIGVMAKTMDAFADNLQNIVIGAMKKISEGDLRVKIEPKNAKDEVSNTLRNTVESLKTVVGAMKKISEGDLSAKIELKSDDDEISAALKTTVESLHRLIIDDGGRVLAAAAGKDLSQRLTGVYSGDFARMRDNINIVMQNLDIALSQVAEAVTQVAGVSGEISNGAQNLAEGSNQQACSLEEVSSSLEEMSSMTKQNAENSNQATILATKARTAANDGDASMRRMVDAIRHIKTSSDNSAKIIKTIDEIAFQTDLLAINAAVEAARAGESGKGFAVVAEEVRNLAMRSVNAAKSTTEMIEESVKNADSGVKIAEDVAKSLCQIVTGTGKVGDLIAEIAAASNEQAQGIEQVNIAVAQMNQVTQRNAANSEESASASEELNNQAAELSNLVSEFTLSGYNGNTHRHQNQHTQNLKRQSHPPQKLPYLPDRKAAGKTKVTGNLVAMNFATSAKAVKAEEIIPLSDDELGEF